MEFVKLGHIIDSFKLDGTFKVVSSTDFASLRYKKGNTIYLSKNNSEPLPLTIEKYHNNGKLDFIKTKEINVKEEAEQYIGYEILFNKDEAEIPEGYYRYDDLVGLRVFNEEKKEMGEVVEVKEFPAQVTLRVVSIKDTEFYVPFVPFFIKEVDLKNNTLIIHEIGGML